MRIVSVSLVGPSGSDDEGREPIIMNFKNRGIRGALVAVAVAMAVASVPAVGGAADAKAPATKHAILKAIL